MDNIWCADNGIPIDRWEKTQDGKHIVGYIGQKKIIYQGIPPHKPGELVVIATDYSIVS